MKNLEEIFTNLIQTLTSEAWVLYPKAYRTQIYPKYMLCIYMLYPKAYPKAWVQGRSPRGGCGRQSHQTKKKIFFFSFVKYWMHYKGKIQNQSQLKNKELHKKNSKYHFRNLSYHYCNWMDMEFSIYYYYYNGFILPL